MVKIQESLMYDEKESEIGCMSVIFRGASIICSKLKKKKKLKLFNLYGFITGSGNLFLFEY